MEWIFNIEKAPWWGGVFERLIRSTKRCLRKMVRSYQLTIDELCTALTEVESMLNSRPLSFVSSDDLEEPLTPSHLIMGRQLLSMPDHLGVNIDPVDTDFSISYTSTQLRDRVRQLNGTLKADGMMNIFWNYVKSTDIMITTMDTVLQSQSVMW